MNSVWVAHEHLIAPDPALLCVELYPCLRVWFDISKLVSSLEFEYDK